MTRKQGVLVTQPGREIASKEIRVAALAAVEQGWRYEYRGRGAHPRLLSPDGVTVVTLPTTTNSMDGLRNKLAELRRAGVVR